MHDAHLLFDSAILFGAALVTASLFRLVRAPSLIGFLCTGFLIGPSGLQLISADEVTQFAEFGLVLLLFVIGLELSPAPLLRNGRRLLMITTLQVVGTTAVAGAFLFLVRGAGISAAAIFGLAVSLSSTAIALGTLSDRRETETIGGIVTTGILLLQDVLVLAVMLVLPMCAGGRGEHLTAAVGRQVVALGVMAAAIVLLRLALPRVVNLLSRPGARELMVLFGVAMACAGASGAAFAGWSPALGACIAGLVLSQTSVRHQLMAEITPFRDVFNALFFISMGMLVDATFVRAQPIVFAAAVVGTLVVKTIIAAVSIRTSGWPSRLALQVGLGLCTVSEFGYVLVAEAGKLGLISDIMVHGFVAYAVCTMMFGAVLVSLAGPIAARFSRRDSAGQSKGASPHSALTGHVIIVGFGVNGHNLARVLRATGTPFSVVDMNPGLIRAARLQTEHCIVGDASRAAILEHAGLESARALVIGIHDQPATRSIVAQARERRPDLYILARTPFVSEIDELYRLGASVVIPEEFETSIEIFAHVLNEFAVPQNVIEAQIALIRAEGYAMFRGQPLATAAKGGLLHLFEGTTIQTFLLYETSPACRKSLRELDLRAVTGTTILAVLRGGKPNSNPSPDFQLEAGDVLALVGAHDELDRAKALLRGPGRK